VATNNTDGTLSRFDFPGNDYNQTPVESLFGSGAGYGDHTGVGPDGCWYVSNGSVKYADGTSGGTGMVRICPGFAPPVGVSTISLVPLSQTAPGGTTANVTATVLDSSSNPLPGKAVTATVLSGPDAGQVRNGTTGGGGTVVLGVTNGGTAGTDTVHATFIDSTGNTQVSNVVSVTFTEVTLGGPTITTHASPGNELGAPVRDTATLTGGSAPTGTVTFRLFNDIACANQVMTSTNALAGSSATSDWFVPAATGTYYWTARYNGDAHNQPAYSGCNAANESATIAPFAPPAYTRTITGDYLGPLTVNAGESVLVTSARVAGGVNVKPGGALSVVSSQFSKGIVADGPTFFSLCDAKVAGPAPAPAVSVSNATVPIRIGDTANGCAGNRFAGDVNLSSDLAITFGNNIATNNVNVNNNGPGYTIIKGDAITLALACFGNAPPPTNAGQADTAGSRSGQCVGL
jgi:hypothetical protein